MSAATPSNFQGERFPVEHRYQPAHRTNKLLTRPVPVHVLRPVNRVDLLGEKLAQNLRRRPAFLGDFRDEVLAFASCHSLEVRDVHPGLLGESMGGRGGHTVLERHAGRRPINLFRNISLTRGHSRHQDCQTARRVDRRNCPIGEETFALQQFLHTLAQIQRCGIDHPCRNLFATDFKQKVGHFLCVPLCPLWFRLSRHDR